VSAGAVAGLEGRSDEAIDLLVAAINVFEHRGAHDEIIWCRMWLGAFTADSERFADAIEHTRLGLALARRTDSTVGTVYLANQHAENNCAGDGSAPNPEKLVIGPSEIV